MLLIQEGWRVGGTCTGDDVRYKRVAELVGHVQDVLLIQEGCRVGGTCTGYAVRCRRVAVVCR